MFSLKDFQANPGKYRLFKTAVVAKNFPTIDIPVGTIVKIQWFDNKVNASAPGNPLEPVYEVQGFKHYVYANALSDFCL